MIDTTILQKYIGLKIIKCKGYHPDYNPEKNYRKAKEPVGKWKEAEILTEDKLYEFENWLNNNGWIGLVIPDSYVALDIEGEEWTYIHDFFNLYDFNRLEHISNFGGHIIFKLNNNKITNRSNIITKIGIILSAYRKGEESYIVVSPSNNRRWVNDEIDFNSIDVLPTFLEPVDMNNYEEVKEAICWRLRWLYLNEVFAGYEDIDLSFMGYLVDHKLHKEECLECFKIIYQDEYDEYLTKSVYERAVKLEHKRGSGSFITKIKEVGDDYLLKLINRFEDLLLKQNVVVDDSERYISVEEIKMSNLVKTFKDLMSEREEVKWVIPSFLAKGYLTIISGQPKVGKTWLLIYLAIKLAQGKEVFNVYPSSRSKILIFEGDMNKNSIKHRFNMMITDFDDINILNDNIVIVNKHDIERVGYIADISKKEGQDLFLSTVDYVNPDVIIIDSISAFHSISEEKSSEVKPVIQFLNYMAGEKNKAVIVIHHFRKKTYKQDDDSDITLDDIAGSNVFTRFAGFIYGMKKYKKQTAYDTGLFDLGSWFDVIKYVRFKKRNESGKMLLQFMEVDKNINPYYFTEFLITESINKFGHEDKNYIINGLMNYLDIDEYDANNLYLKTKIYI